MLIGTQYSDTKLYRGIRHYDRLPLTSGDIHEYSDTVYMKNSYLMNNIIGYGTLNNPKLSISSEGIRLQEPSVLLIDGDISLIQSDDNTNLVSIADMEDAGHLSGAVCVVGWYQQLLASSTMRNYGGVRNSIIENDLMHPVLDMQVSTRYQFRWTIALLSQESISNGNLSFSLLNRDATGAITSGSSTINTSNKKDNIFIASKPTNMEYAESDLYIIPLIKYDYSGNTISNSSMYLPIKPKGTAEFINSEIEPRGEFTDGTTWYNPITREFKTYIAGTGFVDSASKMGFLQYQSVYSMPDDVNTSQNIVIPINISEFQEGDLLQVNYEGLSLVPTEHYSVDYDNHTVTLLDFTADTGDKITFTVTRLVEANDITSITATFTSHMALTGSGTVEAHVKLSDATDSNSDANGGIAATPKAVYESTLIADTANNKKYKFGVENGLLYLEEV